MTNQTVEPQVNWSPDMMVEVVLNEPDDFLKVRETLTRIGVASRKEKKLYQSCHILHKQGKYYITHFKELFALDGKHANLTINDVQRRNRIARLLSDWGLVTIVREDDVLDIAPLNQIKVLSFRDKDRPGFLRLNIVLEVKRNLIEMKTIERHRYRDKKIFQTRTLKFDPYPMTEIESVMGSIASNLKPEMVTKNIVQRMQPIQCLGIAIMPSLCST